MRDSTASKVVCRVAGFAGALAIVCGLVAAASLSGEAADIRATWKAKFARPAAIPFPSDNPYSGAKAALGQALFFDPILSGSQTISCASCHNPALAWQDNRPKGVGEKTAPRRTPTLLNIAWVPKPGWPGHFKDLENVAFTPITSPALMNLPETTAIERLAANPGYVKAFDKAFGKGPITRRKVELALATYQRSIVSTDAPFDRWIKGDNTAIDDGAKRGFALFVGKANCVGCHSGFSFTDSSFHDIGSASGDDVGRGKLFPTSAKLKYAFKTPTLRDVAQRPPYMHDGSVATLEEVVDLYDRGGVERPSRADEIKPLGLSAAEKADLVVFLRTLNGVAKPVTVPVLPR